MKQKHGFSLFELLIACGIISMMLAFGFSSYTQHTVHAKRLLAAGVLTQMALALEEYEIEHGSYVRAPLTKLVSVPKRIAGDYEFVLESATASGFVLAAKPRGVQAVRDSVCGELILNSKGIKEVKGNGTVDECWC